MLIGSAGALTQPSGKYFSANAKLHLLTLGTAFCMNYPGLHNHLLSQGSDQSHYGYCCYQSWRAMGVHGEGKSSGTQCCGIFSIKTSTLTSTGKFCATSGDDTQDIFAAMTYISICTFAET